MLLRRVVLPMREVVNSLMRRDIHLLDEEMTHYYQDVYDHVLRATEWTESLRHLVTTILETRLTIQGNRLNEIMKKLTGWAAIIAIPTAVTGFYGQNVPYPASARPGASCPAWSSSRSSPEPSTPCSSGKDGCEQVGRFRGRPPRTRGSVDPAEGNKVVVTQHGNGGAARGAAGLEQGGDGRPDGGCLVNTAVGSTKWLRCTPCSLGPTPARNVPLLGRSRWAPPRGRPLSSIRPAANVASVGCGGAQRRGSVPSSSISSMTP